MTEHQIQSTFASNSVSENTRIRTNVRPGVFQIDYRRIETLAFDTRNPRQHPHKQVQQIADSIREFGFITPVVVDDKNQIVIGHGRTLAAKLLGMNKVPVIEIKHLSPAQLKALRIADNKIASNAHWDERLLGEEFDALQSIDLDFKLEITGFSAPEIDLMVQDLRDASASNFMEENIVTGPAVCRIGDLWLLDHHRVICADATTELAYALLLETRQAHVVFTDPPYNVRIDGHATGNGKIKHREFAQASGEMSRIEFTCFLRSVCDHLARFTIDGSIHFICMDWRHCEELLNAGKQAYSELKNINVWTKNSAGMGSLYRSQHEFVFVFKCGTARHVNNIQLGKNGRHRSNVWSYPGAATESRRGNNLLALHPTAKPVPMVMDAILDCSHRGDIVLDPFLGSGTTLVAAERTGRTCSAIELDPIYVDTAIRRWQNLTGREARRATDMKTFRDIEAHAECLDDE